MDASCPRYSRTLVRIGRRAACLLELVNKSSQKKGVGYGPTA